MKNLIFNKYVEAITKLLIYTKKDKFWKFCNQDEENEYLFWVAVSQIENFDWGVIILNDLQQEDSLLDTDILYLIPRLHNSKSNIKNTTTSLKSNFSNYDRVWWTFEFVKMMNSWIVANLFYSFHHPLLSEKILEIIISGYLEKEFKKICKNWINKNDQLNQFKIIDIPITITKYLSRKRHAQDFLESLTPSVIQNLTTSQNELFFLFYSDNKDDNWILLDIRNKPEELMFINELVPGIIQLPEFSSTDTYNPIPQSYITWKIELAQRIDAWLFATFVYDSFGLNAEQLTNIFNSLDINNTLQSMYFDND